MGLGLKKHGRARRYGEAIVALSIRKGLLRMNELTSLPYVIFMGDLNSGKSLLINALLRRNTLDASREESRALPTFINREDHTEASFAALSRDTGLELQSHEQFLNLRHDEADHAGYVARAAQVPRVPFSRLAFIDTAGMSSDVLGPMAIRSLADQENALLVVVTDIEYWAARHNMAFIAEHHAMFGRNLVVVANKADHLNADEVVRIRDKAALRMEDYGIAPAPRFFALSARLEMTRSGPPDEYRMRTKQPVRDLCDAGFDQLRVALYEFEAAHATLPPVPLEQMVSTPLAKSFVDALTPQEGAVL